VEVAARLLREHGPAAVTTRGVAQAAGVQAPTIYRLFGDKDGLLDAVAEYAMTSFVSMKSAVVEAALAEDLDPLDDLRAGWQAQIEFGLANPGLSALLSDPVRGLHSPAVRAGAGVLHARVKRVATSGRLRVSEQRAVDLIRAAGTGAVLVLLSTSPDDRDPGFADAMYEAVLRAILTDVVDLRGSAPIAAAVAAAVAVHALAPGLDMLTAPERLLLAEWLERVIEAR